MSALMLPAERHGFWLIWVRWIDSRYMPAVMDDFGNAVRINTPRAHYSLSLEDRPDA